MICPLPQSPVSTRDVFLLLLWFRPSPPDASCPRAWDSVFIPQPRTLSRSRSNTRSQKDARSTSAGSEEELPGKISLGSSGFQ